MEKWLLTADADCRERSCSHHDAADADGDDGVRLILVVRQTERGDNGPW